jgi:succinate dehydrogenase/fumarate reductase flavoprotein subunit
MHTLDCDFIVVGSGAAGLCAAVTAAIKGLDVIVIERADVLGGTTAWSGGWMWLPRNRLAREAGVIEEADAPRAYLASVLGNRFDPDRIDSFLSAAPEMVDFLHAQGFRFEAGNRICDIYGDKPGAGTGGRSLISAPFDARTLGQRISLLRKTKRETAFLGMPIQAGSDLTAFLNATRHFSAFAHVTKRLARHVFDLATRKRATHLVNGVALVARLFEAAERHNVQWMTSANVTSLIEQNGAITGVEGEMPDGAFQISARHGVLLATGGFSQSAALRPKHFPHGKDHVSLAVPEADGSGLLLAQSIGAAFEDDLAAPGAWCPVSRVTWPDGSEGIFPHIIERGKPGIIAVRADGRRFVNEADGYHDFVSALLAATPAGESARSWLICDQEFIRRWGLGIVKPFPVPHGHWRRTGYLKSAPTLEALAAQCGIAPHLVATVSEYNKGAREGRDDNFRRGWSPYNRSQGDPEQTPNPNVAPLSRPPFYAVEVLPGSFGSFAGLKTDTSARVLRQDGSAIEGLYAAGADAANIMAGHYPAGGINLGPAMVFGYLAALSAAAKATQSGDVQLHVKTSSGS